MNAITKAITERDKNIAGRIAKGFAPVIRRLIVDAIQPVADRLIAAETRIAELETMLGVKAKRGRGR